MPNKYDITCTIVIKSTFFKKQTPRENTLSSQSISPKWTSPFLTNFANKLTKFKNRIVYSGRTNAKMSLVKFSDHLRKPVLLLIVEKYSWKRSSSVHVKILLK